VPRAAADLPGAVLDRFVIYPNLDGDAHALETGDVRHRERCLRDPASLQGLTVRAIRAESVKPLEQPAEPAWLSRPLLQPVQPYGARRLLS
jgi:hypothetical protein